MQNDQPDGPALHSVAHLLGTRCQVSALLCRPVFRPAVEDDGDLACYIQIRVVVVVEFRCHDAVADENGPRAYRAVRVVPVRPHGELHRVIQVDGAGSGLEPCNRTALDQLPLGQRHALVKAAVVARRAEAQLVELGSDILGGNPVAARARVATAQTVGGQEFDMGLQPIFIDGDTLGGRRPAKNQCDKGRRPRQVLHGFRSVEVTGREYRPPSAGCELRWCRSLFESHGRDRFAL